MDLPLRLNIGFIGNDFIVCSLSLFKYLIMYIILSKWQAVITNNEVENSFRFLVIQNFLFGICEACRYRISCRTWPLRRLSKYAKRMLACEINLPTSPSPCPHSYCPTSRHAILCITRPPINTCVWICEKLGRVHCMKIKDHGAHIHNLPNLSTCNPELN